MSGRLDPSKKTKIFFELLRKVREIQKMLSKDPLDVWTPQKRVEGKVRMSGRLDVWTPQKRVKIFLTFEKSAGNSKIL